MDKKESNRVVVKSGIGPLTLLAILFIGLKLTGYIDWNWFWVLSPMLIPYGIVAAILLLGLAMAALGGIIVALSNTRRGRRR